MTWTELAATQAGSISRSQLLACGLSGSAIDRRLRSGVLRTVHPGVYAVAGSPVTAAQRRWAALLAVGAGSTLSFESAARIHGLATVPAVGPVVCTTEHSGSQRLAGVVVHQISDVAVTDVERIDGLPVTTVPRTIVDLAATWRPKRMEIVLDDAVAARKTSFADVGECLRSVARRGKPGVRSLAAILDERGPGAVPAASVLERDFFALLAASGLPAPTRQHPLPRLDGTLGLVDAAWVPLRLIVEVDGRRWHQRIADMKRDRDRDLQAAASGWMIVRLLHEHVVGAPEETLRELRRIIASRQALLGVA